MSFVFNNLVAFLIATLGAAMAWAFGGLQGDMLASFVPWLWVLLLEMMLCFPQRHQGESIYAARERVWRRLLHDPLTWVVVGFLLLLAIPFVNVGLCPGCDAERIIVEHLNAEPPVRFLPYCVNRIHHYHVFLWFGPALTAMVAAKHSLLKSGKRLVLEVLVWNGVALGLFGFLQQVLGASGPFWTTPPKYCSHFFSVFGYANVGGAYFTAMFALAVALWRRKVRAAETDPLAAQRKAYSRFWRRHYLLLAALVTLFAAMATLSRAAILLSLALAIIFFVHTAIMDMASRDRAGRVRVGALYGLVLLLVLGAAFLFMPQRVRHEMETVNVREVTNRVVGQIGQGEYHTAVSLELIQDNPFFGCGGWGYAHLSPTKLTDAQRRSLAYEWSTGATNVHNDFLQFAVEHGVIGLGCFLAALVLLLIPTFRTWYRLSKGLRFLEKRLRPPFPCEFFVFPAGGLFVLVGALATCIHACADCPLRSPAVLLLLLVELAALDGFLPKTTPVRHEQAREKTEITQKGI